MTDNRATRRRLSGKKVRGQIAEQVGLEPGFLLPIELASGTIYMRIGSQLDANDAEYSPGSFGQRLKNAESNLDLLEVVLGEYDGASAQEQIDAWLADGGSVIELVLIFQTESKDLNERLGNLKLS